MENRLEGETAWTDPSGRVMWPKIQVEVVVEIEEVGLLAVSLVRAEAAEVKRTVPVYLPTPVVMQAMQILQVASKAPPHTSGRPSPHPLARHQ